MRTIKSRTPRHLKLCHRSEYSSASRLSPAGSEVRTARGNTTPGKYRRARRFQPNRRRTAISHDVFSSHCTSELRMAKEYTLRALGSQSQGGLAAHVHADQRGFVDFPIVEQADQALGHMKRRGAARPRLALSHTGPVKGDDLERIR